MNINLSINPYLFNNSSIEDLEQSLSGENLYLTVKDFVDDEDYYDDVLTQGLKHTTFKGTEDFFHYLNALIQGGEYFIGAKKISEALPILSSDTQDQLKLLKYFYSRHLAISCAKDPSKIKKEKIKLLGLDADIAYISIMGEKTLGTNLDNILIDKEAGVYAIFDGVSVSNSHSTRRYQEKFKECFVALLKEYSKRPRAKLKDVIKAAHKRTLDHVKGDASTTFAGLVKFKDKLYLVGIGDSNAALLSGGDSIYARQHKQEHYVTSSLSSTRQPYRFFPYFRRRASHINEISIKEISKEQLKESNLIVLACDGITDDARSIKFQSCIANGELGVREAIAKALEQFSNDDRTMIAIKV